METANFVLHQSEEPLVEPICPVCGGEVILLREYYRCSRCRHSFCETCEGGTSNEE